MPYPTRAIDVVGTVILIYNNWILDITHGHIFKLDPLDESTAGPGPCLYPKPILSTRETCIFNRHILHSCLYQLSTKASYAANMYIPHTYISKYLTTHTCFYTLVDKRCVRNRQLKQQQKNKKKANNRR